MTQSSPVEQCKDVIERIERTPRSLVVGSLCRTTMIEFLLALQDLFAIPIQRHQQEKTRRLEALQAILDDCNTQLSDLIYLDDPSIPDGVVYAVVRLSTLASTKAKQLLKNLGIRENRPRGSAANLRTKAPILLRRFERP